MKSKRNIFSSNLVAGEGTCRSIPRKTRCFGREKKIKRRISEKRRGKRLEREKKTQEHKNRRPISVVLSVEVSLLRTSQKVRF